jgi:16S rRNA (cytosine1402-N4)-methyltransferase
MLDEVLDGLAIKRSGIYVDGTLGLGGHSKKILEAIATDGRLIGIDCDENALNIARENLRSFSSQCELINENYRNIDSVLDALKIDLVDGILLDLGVSSLQLDDAKRGFSIQSDGPLDMRMDKRSGVSAFDIVNSYSEQELSSIINDYGQERWHKRIARSIVYHREKSPINTTNELSLAVMKALPHGRKRQKIHPATRTFQAIRIVVNRELESLDVILDKYITRLKPSGRICIISFHSLEDRAVKVKFRDAGKMGEINIITKKPLQPTEQEFLNNPRSRSARLRIAERI